MAEFLYKKDMEEMDNYVIDMLVASEDWSEGQINEWVEKRGLHKSEER
jgi:hypothetical protein